MTVPDTVPPHPRIVTTPASLRRNEVVVKGAGPPLGRVIAVREDAAGFEVDVEATEPVRKLAAFIPVSTEVAEDRLQLADWLPRLLHSLADPRPVHGPPAPPRYGPEPPDAADLERWLDDRLATTDPLAASVLAELLRRIHDDCY